MKASFFWKGIQQSGLIIEMMIQKNLMGLEEMEVLLEAYLEPTQTSKMKLFKKTVNGVT